MQKKVSVIIPAFQAERYIHGAIESVLNQTYRNFEIIVVDDASTDGTIAICEKHKSHIKLIKLPKNKGAANARNIGIHHATGDYIAFLDSDDQWYLQKIAKQVKHLEASSDVGLSFCWSLFICSDDKVKGRYIYSGQTRKITTRDLFVSSIIGTSSSVIIKREVLEDLKKKKSITNDGVVEYFDKDFTVAEDIALWLDIKLSTSWTIEGIPEILVLYRDNDKGLTQSNIHKQAGYFDQFAEKCLAEHHRLSKWVSCAKANNRLWIARLEYERGNYFHWIKMIYSAFKFSPKSTLKQLPQIVTQLIMICDSVGSRIFNVILSETKFYLKSFVIYLTTRMQSFPLRYILHLFYKIAIVAVVADLKKISGIHAVYLSGSLAKGESILGLSDIDFRIFIDDQKCEKSIKRIFRKWRTIFTFLGSAKEKQLLYVSDFEENFQIRPDVRHLMDQNFYKDELLWGNDIAKDLSVKCRKYVDNISTCMTYLNKFEYFIDMLHNCLFGRLMTNIQKRYLLYKTIVDSARIFLILKNEIVSNCSKEEILSKYAHYTDVSTKNIIDLLKKERNKFFRNSYIDPEVTYSLFKDIRNDCLHMMGFRHKDENNWMKEETNFNQFTQIDEDIKKDIQLITGKNTNILGCKVGHAVLFDVDYAGFERDIIIIFTADRISLKQMRELGMLYREKLSNKSLLFLKEQGGHCFTSGGAFVEFFRFDDNSRRLAVIENEFRSNRGQYNKLLRYKLELLTLQYDRFIQHDGIYKLQKHELVLYMFTAMQSLFLKLSLDSGNFIFLPSALDIKEYLQQEVPSSKEIIDEIYSEYLCRFSLYDTMQPETLESWKLLLQKIIILAQDKSSIHHLTISKQPKHELLTSVIILTYNRSALLRGCLTSLINMNTIPYEVIIVDNESTDSTSEVVSTFVDKLNIKHIVRPEKKIATLRNAGLSEATGDIIAFLDDDTEVFPNWLSYAEKVFSKKPNAGFAVGDIYNMKKQRNDVISRFMTDLEV